MWDALSHAIIFFLDSHLAELMRLAHTFHFGRGFQISILIRTVMDTDVEMQQRAFDNWERCVMGYLLDREVRKPAKLVLQVLLIVSCLVVTESPKVFYNPPSPSRTE